jgi:hypothetical protein
MFRNAKRFTAILLVLILAASTYAFANANTIVAPGNAGSSTSALSGYTITNVVYDLADSAPMTLNAVRFNIESTTGGAAPVLVKLNVLATPDWTLAGCVADATPPLWVCSFSPAISVLSMTTLQFVATSSTNPAP